MKKHLIKTIAVLLAVLLSLLAVPGLRMIFYSLFLISTLKKIVLRGNLDLN